MCSSVYLQGVKKEDDFGNYPCVIFEMLYPSILKVILEKEVFVDPEFSSIENSFNGIRDKNCIAEECYFICVYIGNITCEICGSTARNVAATNETEMTEQWNEANDSTAAATAPIAIHSAETRNFWQGHRKAFGGCFGYDDESGQASWYHLRTPYDCTPPHPTDIVFP
ncbi:hypothetical protein COLO4_25598 [Corchorus olitorius]|uniref:Uncharacterized protein n=1 Tax=Corchorus olitorius TaxID=93759 RepID=A0A1R3I1C6_9ROSI|nr:hypothetical protein COLO4_25598 [Corchorus olitorius]